MSKSDKIYTDKHIGIFNDSFPPIIDGVTLTVEHYAEYFQEKGKNPLVVTPWNPVKVEKPYPVERFFSLPIKNRHPYRYGYPKLDPFIWRKMREIPFEIVHAHSPFSTGRLGVYAKKHQGVPLIGTFHSKYREDLKHSFRSTPWMVPIIMKRILDFFNACDEVWIPQAQVEETVREYGFKGPLTVMENGNDFKAIPEDGIAEVKRLARQDLGIADDELSMLFVGQHIYEKGIDIIFETLLRLDRWMKWRMDFIGDGYAREDLIKKIHQHNLEDRVKVHGVVTDREKLQKHYAAADLFLFPSLYDNAPLVVREAAAMGTPSIIPEGSTASEVITDGENGFLTTRTPDDMASLILSLYADRRWIRHAGIGASKTLVKSWDEVMEEVMDRYRSLIARKS